MTLREQLLAIFDAYHANSGRSRATISTIVFNGGGVIDRLVDGGDVSTGNFERAVLWFSDNWPAKAKWPKGVARPKKQKVAA